jgi:hypothetical protein
MELQELKPKPELVTTVGFLVKETPDHVVIASCICDVEGYEGFYSTNGHFQIPKSMIKDQKTLKVKI